MSDQTDPRIQQKLDEIQARFQERIKKIQENGAAKINEITDDSPEPNNVEATLNVTFDVKFKTTEIKFDIPRIGKELQRVIFDVPVVTMELKTISWDVPTTKMETRCITKKPVTVCKGGGGWPPKLPSCTIKWECVYMDFPVVTMKRMEVKLDMPQFSTRQQEISFDKPVFSMETITIKLDLPQFYLRDLSGDLREQEAEFEEVGKEMESQVALANNEMNDSLVTEVGGQVDVIFNEIRAQLLQERAKVAQQFDEGIAKMKISINTLKENNATEEVARLETELAKLIEDYKNVLDEIDANMKDLNKEQEDVINSIKLSKGV
ncbi:hypothetical protein [Pedobacter sp. MW01-1-1]|uniref:hypothetical protein n=1 Tax=Pedobacter sp. MW01-1-1 TaxID=3383027 RepID=UPI003FEFD966